MSCFLLSTASVTSELLISQKSSNVHQPEVCGAVRQGKGGGVKPGGSNRTTCRERDMVVWYDSE